MAGYKQVPIYTTHISNHANTIPLGLVVGNDRERVSYLRHAVDNFLTLFGGSSGLMRKKMDDLIKNAKLDLYKNTWQQFPEATGIYDAHFHVSNGTRHLEVTITGTAVIEKDKLFTQNSKRSSTSKVKAKKKKATRRQTRRNSLP
jgi:uncharacterized protein YbjQ (UPF0145 family)